MENRIFEKHELRYLIATTVSGVPMYLKKKLQQNRYSFVYDVADAIKTTNKEIAESVISFYRSDTRDNETDLVIIPLLITYELIKED